MPGRRAERTLRIIGGNWRSRKVSFPERDEIRPTPDRVRETLFNWLQFDIGAATCLELYGGSGILSMEALSRGAGHVTIVEKDEQTFKAISANLATLCQDQSRYTLICKRALEWLSMNSSSFDLIFLDPPFSGPELQPVLTELIVGNHVTSGGFVYIESGFAVESGQLPSGLSMLKQQVAGQVHYCLCSRTGP